MAEYFYTLDLGEPYGPKLEELAAQASYDDVEAFAALLLRDAIDWLERDLTESAGVDEPEAATGPIHDLDDDIPF